MQSVTAYALDIQERSDPRFGITSEEVLRNCTRQLPLCVPSGETLTQTRCPDQSGLPRTRLVADLAGAPEDISQPPPSSSAA